MVSPMMLFLVVFFVCCCLPVMQKVLSNLLVKIGKHNGYFGKPILKNEMDIPGNEVKVVNDRRTNCAKCNA